MLSQRIQNLSIIAWTLKKRGYTSVWLNLASNSLQLRLKKTADLGYWTYFWKRKWMCLSSYAYQRSKFAFSSWTLTLISEAVDMTSFLISIHSWLKASSFLSSEKQKTSTWSSTAWLNYICRINWSQHSD